MRRIRDAVVCSIILAAAAPALAQETTGSIIGRVVGPDGQALAGATVTLANPATGFERATLIAADGDYRFPALPPAGYTVTVSLEGFQSEQTPVGVVVGQTARVEVVMRPAAFTGTVEVTDHPPLLDPTATVAGLAVSVDELSSQVPVSRDVTRLSLLAPGTVPGDDAFESAQPDSWMFTPGQRLVSFGGASVAENAYLVNGLNISNVSMMMGSSFVPMEFVEQAQVKTGGYEAEFGRSTGGVVNLVTKSGTNTLRGSVSAYWLPEGLQEQEPDTYNLDFEGNTTVARHNQDEERSGVEANASLGGPLLRDRLFFFAFARWIDADSLDIWDTRAQRLQESSPYFGAKLDWVVSAGHRLEGTYFSDRTDVDVDLYEFDPATRSVAGFMDHGVRSRGGDNGILRYSGLLSDSLLLAAQVGRNEQERSNQSDRADVCPVAYDWRSGSQQSIGCWMYQFVHHHWDDQRTAYRVDVDWYLGRHSLRAGADLETMQNDFGWTNSGGVLYEYWLNGERYPALPAETELVSVRHLFASGIYDSRSNAAYLQDSWAVTPGLTLNLGVRWERSEIDDAAGKSFLAISDQVAPRLGAAWDPAGNGRSKLFGSLGVYHLPIVPSAAQAGQRLYSDWGWYVLEEGVNPDGSPQGLGDELDFTVYHEWGVADTRTAVDSSVEPTAQQELVLGYERLLGGNWSFGVRGVGRRFDQVIEDITIDQGLRDVYGVQVCVPYCLEFRITNPGTDFSGWYDLDGDGVLDPVSFTAEQLGIPEAERSYYALELSVERRFADGWMVQGSYTWSHSYGNYEGLMSSDAPQYASYLTSAFDTPGLMEHASGDLPNDRRHNLKIFGVYSWPWGLQVGGSSWYLSGRPVNGFGMHPTDQFLQDWYGPVAFYNNGVACPRGCGGTGEASWALDLMARYEFEALGASWNVRVDAFNLLDNQAAVQVDEVAELITFEPSPSYRQPRYYQPPRSVRLGFGVSF